MHECLEALKGQYVEVALTNQTLHGVLDDVVANDPIFLVLEEEDYQKILVNLQHVTEVIPFTRNSFSLRISDDEGSLIPLSKTAAAELRQLLDY